MKKPPPSGADFRAQVVAMVLKLLYCCQPEEAIAVLDEARKAYRTFDEIFADEAAAKAKAPAAPAAKPLNYGDFG